MPCNYKLYPENWLTEIRPRILKRAKDKCEFCGVVNYSWINRHTREIQLRSEEDSIRVILTIAHLDHDIKHNEDSNLKALCQKCHNNYDRKNRNKNIRTRKMKNQLTLNI